MKSERTTRNLKCDLTEEEWAERSNKLAEVERDMRALEKQRKQVASDLKARKDAFDGQLGALAAQVRERAEFRDVDCRIDYDGDEVLVVRADTETVVERRKALPAELQEELPIGDPPPKPEGRLRRRSEK